MSTLKALLTAALVAGAVAPATAHAQDRWNPFGDDGYVRLPPPRTRPAAPADAEAQKPPLLPPMKGDPRYDGPPAPTAGTPQAGYDAAPPFAPAQAVEKADLAPLAAPDAPQPASQSPASEPAAQPAPARPVGAITQAQAEAEATAPASPLATAELPTRSPALAGLVRDLLTGRDQAAGAPSIPVAQRVELLWRAGHAADALAVLPPSSDAASPLLAVLEARIAIATGDRDRGCAAARSAAANRAALTPPLKADLMAAQGYCAAATGNPAAAGLTAGLAREERVPVPAETLGALDAVAAGEAPELAAAKRVTAFDYRLAELVKRPVNALSVDRADPPLLALIATQTAADAGLRLAAASAAVRINAIDAAALAATWRRQSFTAEELAQPQTARVDGARRHALMFNAAEAERTPAKKVRLVRAALDDARRASLYWPTAVALAPTVSSIEPAVEIGWFAETAVEVLLAAGRYDRARNWVAWATRQGPATDRGGLAHWLALIDVAEPGVIQGRGESLAALEELALRGRFTPDALHRLATVLDALDYQVPFRLWEAASRTAQPSSGFLPPSGLLTELQAAAKVKDHALVAALVIRTVGPNGVEGAHLIALGDSIRALKRAGLERHARLLALEAMFASWPRSGNT